MTKVEKPVKASSIRRRSSASQANESDKLEDQYVQTANFDHPVDADIFNKNVHPSKKSERLQEMAEFN